MQAAIQGRQPSVVLFGYLKDDKLDVKSKVIDKAKKGEVKAIYEIATHYFKINQMKRAVEWFRFAYEKGSTLALKRLGDMYQDGNGVKADPVTALDIYIKAAELRDKDAAMVLCGRFKNGNKLCPADTRLSREWSYQGEHGEGLFETYNKEIGFGSGSYDIKPIKQLVSETREAIEAERDKVKMAEEIKHLHIDKHRMEGDIQLLKEKVVLLESTIDSFRRLINNAQGVVNTTKHKVHHDDNNDLYYDGK